MKESIPTIPVNRCVNSPKIDSKEKLINLDTDFALTEIFSSLLTKKEIKIHKGPGWKLLQLLSLPQNQGTEEKEMPRYRI